MRRSTSRALAGESTMVTRSELTEVVLTAATVPVVDSDPASDGGIGSSSGSVTPVDAVIDGVGTSTDLVNSLGTGALGADKVLPDNAGDDLNGATMVLFSSLSAVDLVVAGDLISDIAWLGLFSSIRRCVSGLVNVENNCHKKLFFRGGFNTGYNGFRKCDLIIAFRTIIIGRIHADICGSSTAATNTTNFNRA